MSLPAPRSAARLLVTVVVALLPLTAVGCNEKKISAEDRRVCVRLQTMVDALGHGRNAQAVEAYDAMIAGALEHDRSSRIGRLVAEMSSITDARVDESKLKMSEVAELADQAMRASGNTLTKLVDECGRAGLPVTGLDRAGAGA